MLAYKFFLRDAMKNSFDNLGVLPEWRKMNQLWRFSLVVIFFCAFVANAHAVKFIEIADGSFAESGEGDVIVFTKAGKPILPDLESRGKRSQAQENEISFTFNSPEYPWSAGELATLQQWVNDLYPVIKKIYGSPAFSISVNISKNPSISSDGYYCPGSNEGVKLYELGGTILHAKTAVIDGVWSTVGSTNMDLWSFLRNDEVNAVVLSREFATEMEAMFANDLSVSNQILLEQWKERSLKERLKEWFTRLFSRWL